MFDKLSPVSLATQMALTAPTGGGNLVMSQVVKHTASRFGQQYLQQMGRQMGIPQSEIDLAQARFASSVGDFRGAAHNYQQFSAHDVVDQFFRNATPSQRGQIESGADSIKKSISDWIARGTGVDSPDGVSHGKGSRGGGSWLMALAEGLGRKLDQAQAKLESTMDSTDWENAGDSARFQAMSQEFALFMNAATNVIKTVGESLATMAKKN